MWKLVNLLLSLIIIFDIQRCLPILTINFILILVIFKLLITRNNQQYNLIIFKIVVCYSASVDTRIVKIQNRS
jgi:hypothetical protein